ncbi:IS3 family transposase [Salmonella enterica subsp. enterica serovar Stanleyville]|uniref:IS3 family transposase n=2 Tax=Salmonella enterica I TaxID=59201 RepID=A0A3U2TPV1_SALET|nr:IS3 family transposase [Salmonella enterica]AZT17304.1 IS3 family transposase [Salmonella enterica subsp. enterica serovar Stanleyville]EBP9977936.1 IS3 family transposase [Salmonella enterica subsp. enterica]ECK7263472.1 IS3 family transposase [Salmonella enterica subsp. enterica serovar Banana]EAA3662300.1 IS3 family transposase [Salmonella enterica subsp. enterica serovar Stanleyville]EBF9511676.1 IS3 family transposase [Salmonella enterica subsp. enterica serovar Stanleyville]
MTKPASTTKKPRKQHTPEFRQEALKLAERIGVAAAARELNLYESQLYNWRSKQQNQLSSSEREQEMSAEIARLKRQLAERDEELAILQKGRDILREAPEMKYVFIEKHQAEFNIKAMCRVLQIARSGWYVWHQRRHQINQRQRFRLVCDNVVREAFSDAKQRYGAPRLTDELRAQGYQFNVKTVAASLRRQGLRAKASRRFRPVSYRKHDLPVSENLLKQDFYASGPNQKWVGDITYLRTGEGWLYLAVIIDLWSRSVIGWSMSSRMTAQLACDALQMALWRRKCLENVIVHTDRGGQYCSTDYQSLLKRHNLRGSMSARGCCYDNACAESFFHTLKVECIHGEDFVSREIMRTAVFNYIECDYNRWRRHSACGGLSPEQFENQNLA